METLVSYSFHDSHMTVQLISSQIYQIESRMQDAGDLKFDLSL
jgi:hypothetical protein